MTDPSPDNDDVLLRRLNELKKSGVLPSHHSSSENDPEEDVASRFLRLKGGPKDRSTLLHSAPPTATTVDNDKDEIPWNPEDDLTIEELLAELGTEDQWIIDGGGEETDAEKLIGEAKKALNAAQESKADVSASAVDGVGENSGETKEYKGLFEGREDEEEAARYVAKILEDLDLRKKYGQDIDNGNSDEGSSNGDELAALEFPSLPASDPEQPAPDNDTSVASLLPSAPTLAPLSSKKKTKSSLPTYTDAEIATWCVICNDDAVVRCLGCDGDLYCRGCWGEGHTGRDAGLEESGHRWIVYRRPGS